MTLTNEVYTDDFIIPQSEDKFSPEINYLPILNFEFFTNGNILIPIYAQYSTMNELHFIRLIESDSILLNFFDQICSSVLSAKRKGVSIYWATLFAKRELNKFLNTMAPFKDFPVNKYVVAINVSSFDMILCSQYFPGVDYIGDWVCPAVKDKGLKGETYQGEIIKLPNVVFENGTNLLSYGHFKAALAGFDNHKEKVKDGWLLLKEIINNENKFQQKPTLSKDDLISNSLEPPTEAQASDLKSSIELVDRNKYSLTLDYVSKWIYKSPIQVEIITPLPPKPTKATLHASLKCRMVFGVITKTVAYLCINYPLVANSGALRDCFFIDMKTVFIESNRASNSGYKEYKFYVSGRKEVVCLNNHKTFSHKEAYLTNLEQSVINLVNFLNKEKIIKYIIDFNSEDKLWEAKRWGQKEKGYMSIVVDINKRDKK